MKGRIKRLLSKTNQSPVHVNVDIVCQYKDHYFVCGWAANTAAPIKTEMQIKGVDGIFPVVLCTYSRSDVVKELKLPSNEYAFGFVGVFDKKAIKDFALASLCVESGVFSFANPTFQTVSHPEKLIIHAGKSLEKVKAFVESHITISWPTLDANHGSPVVDKDIEFLKETLSSVNIHDANFLDDCAQEYLPEIHKVWQKRQALANDAELLSFGDGVVDPIVSIIVPLYGRYDFMQHQIAHFSQDPEFKQVELIYVLDDPRLIHEVKVTAYGVHQIFKMPFKVVLSERNLGFSGANNLGVSYASSDLILLLNSDIIPSKPQWLAHYIAQYRQLDNVGILGATLIYEDDTIQHAGMEFRADSSYPGIWMNHHPLKGVPLAFANLPSVQKVQSTTGACMLMSKALFNEVGGFNPLYVLGDFEDSDLCLKCIDKGLSIYLSGDVVLYHLERLSQNLVDAGDWKFKLTMVNGSYQVHQWQSVIEELTA